MIRRVDPINYFFYYSLTVMAIVLSLVFFSLTWRELLLGLSVQISFRRAFLYCLVANFVDLLLPTEAISGEAIRLYLTSKGSGESRIGRVTASLVIHRLLSMTTTLIGLLAGSAIILLDYKVTFYLSSLLITVSAGTSATIFLLLYLSLRRGPAERLIDWVLGLASSISRGRLNIAKWRERILNVLWSFHQGIDVIRAHPKNLIKPVIFSVLSWFFYLSTYHMVFCALGLDVPFAVSMVVFSISVAVQTVPVGIPVGLVEIVMTTLYTLFNIDIAISGTATALIRVVTFWFRIVIGYAAAQWIGVEALLRRS